MRILWAAAVIAVLAPGVASAQTKTAQFAVRASVLGDCQISANDLEFGTYDPAAAKSGNTTFTVQCTPNLALTIAINGGQSGNPQDREMVGPAGVLGYLLYRDAALQDPIVTLGELWQVENAANTGQLMTYNIYGQIPAGQSVAQGSYVDLVQITVSY